MGKFFSGLLVGVLVIILCALVAHQSGACKISFNSSGPGDTELICGDSAYQESVPMNVLDKQYSFVNDVLLDHQELVVDVQYTDAFREIPEATLQNVTSLLLRTRPYITIKDIVNEYLTNQQIYDNIQPNAVIDPGANKDSINKTTAEAKPQESTDTQDPNPVAAQEQLQSINSNNNNTKSTK